MPKSGKFANTKVYTAKRLRRKKIWKIAIEE
jgi:hypothetical protein